MLKLPLPLDAPGDALAGLIEYVQAVAVKLADMLWVAVTLLNV